MNHRLSTLALVSTLLAACAQGGSTGLDQQRLNDAVRSRPIVLLGEVHDNAAQHEMRARALRSLLESGARPALLMEQFDRERQADIDRALARPGATPDDVIAAGSPGDAAMQGWSWPFYKPYLSLAIDYKLTIVAANVSRADTRRVLKEGLPALGFDARVPDDIRAEQADEIAASHCGMLDADTAGRMVGAQVARDQFMAREIEANAARGAVLIAGNGHVRRDVGVPRWLTAQVRARSVSIGLLESGDTNTAAFDVVVVTPAQPRTDPCEGMRGAPKR